MPAPNVASKKWPTMPYNGTPEQAVLRSMCRVGTQRSMAYCHDTYTVVQGTYDPRKIIQTGTLHTRYENASSWHPLLLYPYIHYIHSVQ
jgi:hypothetical protein